MSGVIPQVFLELLVRIPSQVYTVLLWWRLCSASIRKATRSFTISAGHSHVRHSGVEGKCCNVFNPDFTLKALKISILELKGQSRPFKCRSFKLCQPVFPSLLTVLSPTRTTPLLTTPLSVVPMGWSFVLFDKQTWLSLSGYV